MSGVTPEADNTLPLPTLTSPVAMRSRCPVDKSNSLKLCAWPAVREPISTAASVSRKAAATASAAPAVWRFTRTATGTGMASGFAVE